MALARLGETLGGIDPLHQPPELNSLILAVEGVGWQSAPVAVVQAVGAVLLATGSTIARRRAVRAVPATSPA